MIPFLGPSDPFPAVHSSSRLREGRTGRRTGSLQPRQIRSSIDDPAIIVQKQALVDGALLVGLRPLFLGLAVAISGATIYRVSTLPFEWGLATLAVGLLVGGAFLGARWLLVHGRIPVRWAHPIAALLLAVGYLFVLYNIVFRLEEFAELRFVGLTLVVTMIGALFLRLRWFVSMMAVIFGSWTVANIALGLPLSWSMYLILFPIIGTVALANFAARKQAISRMIDTQLEHDLQTAQLAEALERAHQSEAQLKVERDLADQIVESMAQGLVLIDARGRIEYVNPAAENILGQPSDELVGRVADSVLRMAVDAVQPRLSGGASADAEGDTREMVVDRGDDEDSHVLVSSKSRDGGGFILSLTDLTLRKRFESRLHRLAHYDALTGLANRSLLDDRIQTALVDIDRGQSSIGLLFLDIDGFKPINDTAGHAVGDLMLIEIAHRILESIRAQDTAARIGGDEFVVLLDGIDDAELALKVADRIAQRVREPVVVEGLAHSVGVSIGIVISRSPDADPEELIRAADSAMYEAKRRADVTRILYSVDEGPNPSHWAA